MWMLLIGGKNNSMRLDQFIAQTAHVSRSTAKQIILKGRVKVGDEQIKNPKFHVKINHDGTTQPVVIFKGEKLSLEGKRYILLNKPQGYICSTKDEVYPSALNLLKSANTQQLHFGGRLDQDSTGLVLISDDGQWTHNITSPKKSCIKTYLVSTIDPLTEVSILALRRGVLLNGESKITTPNSVSPLSDNQLRLSISEGKYHQVKRMLAAVGNRVTKLHRESVGGIELGKLQVGEWRRLTTDEVNLFC
jgi:16S rRNA pseudouridine516 synthase